MKATYKHNCKDCKLIGTTVINESGHPGKTILYKTIDIYLCGEFDLVVRYGNNPEDHTYMDLRCGSLLDVIRGDKMMSAGYSLLQQGGLI